MDDKEILLLKIRCQEKSALNWIKNGLEEARDDFKEVGRPLTIEMHIKEHFSLLSDAFKDSEGKKIEMKGVLNLLLLLLFITNVKNVLIMNRQHGFQLTSVFKSFVESKVYAIPENYQTIAGLFTLPIFTANSYWIEIMATYKGFSRIILFTLITLNQVALLTYPMILSFKVETDQIVGAALFMYTVATSLKLISFHHTMHDVRGLVIRVIKAKETNTELTPSKIEGTILGVNQETFDEALTYPKCLSVKSFLRFMSSPTFCY